MTALNNSIKRSPRLNLFPKNKKCIFYFPKIPNKPALMKVRKHLIAGLAPVAVLPHVIRWMPCGSGGCR